MDNDLLGLLGLAKKAGKLALGEEAVIDAALAHKARLILLASDAAGNTAAKVERSAAEGNALCFRTELTKAQLGSAVGLAACAAAGLTDVGLAAAAAKKLAAAQPDRYGEAALHLERKAEKTVRRRREKRRRLKSAQSPKPWVAPPKEQQE